MRAILSLLLAFTLIGNVLANDIIVNKIVIDENVKGERVAEAIVQIPLSILKTLNEKSTLFVDFGDVDPNNIKEFTVGGSTVMQIDPASLQVDAGQADGKGKNDPKRTVSFRTLKPGMELFFPPLSKRGFGKGTKVSASNSAARPKLLRLDPNNGLFDPIIATTKRNNYKTTYRKVEVILPELINVKIKDDRWAERSGTAKIKVSTATLFDLTEKSQVLIDFGKNNGNKEEMLVSGRAICSFDMEQIEKLKELVKAGEIKKSRVACTVKIGYTNIELVLAYMPESRGFGKGTKNTATTTASRPELLHVIPNPGDDTGILVGEVADDFELEYSFYTNPIEGAMHKGGGRIRITVDGWGEANIGMRMKRSNPINKLNEDEKVFVTLKGGKSALNHITCPCEKKNETADYVQWECAGRVGDENLHAQLIKEGLLPGSEDNLTNSKHKDRSITIWDYERMVMHTADGKYETAVEAPDGEKGFEYDIKYPVTHARKARWRRRYKERSGVLTVNLYESGAERIVGPGDDNTTAEEIKAILSPVEGSGSGIPKYTNITLKRGVMNEETGVVTYYSIGDPIPDSFFDIFFDVELKYNGNTISGITVPPLDGSNKSPVRTSENAIEAASARVQAYPNPTNGELTLNFGQTYETINVRISNIAGQVILDEQVYNANQYQMELNQEAGIYFIELFNATGNIETLKVIKR